jgi:hypothetical protein
MTTLTTEEFQAQMDALHITIGDVEDHLGTRYDLKKAGITWEEDEEMTAEDFQHDVRRGLEG